MAKAGGNRAPGVTPEEQKDYNKLDVYKFPWTLSIDKEEIEKYRPKAIFHNVDLPVVVLIGPDF